MENNYVKDRLLAEAIARRAGKFIQQERNKGFAIKLKGFNDIVTSIDIASEALIKSLISEIYPDDSCLGEESGSDHDSSGRRWVIDPIDGTLNFSNGIPMYCVSIALQIDGKSVAGAIYDPNKDELFSASVGNGAYLNSEKIHVSECPSFDKSILVTGFPPQKSNGFNNLENFTRLCHDCRAVRRLGSAALDLCYVAAGRFDGFWEFGLKPWDTAAGYLLVNEAGGKVTSYEGAEFDSYQKSIVASNGPIHQNFIEALRFDE